jgi:hypothetical protein
MMQLGTIYNSGWNNNKPGHNQSNEIKITFGTKMN